MMRKWKVASSFVINHPEFIEANTTTGVMTQIQNFADTYPSELKFGKLQFRVRGRGPWETVQAFYINRHGDKTRFMRVEEVDLGKVRIYISIATVLDDRGRFKSEPVVGVGYTPDAAELEMEREVGDFANNYLIEDTVCKELPIYAPSS
jgi:hypothetical protein